MATKTTKITKIENKKQKTEIPLVDMTASELETKAGQIKAHIAKTKLELATGRVKNRRSAFTLRKELARVLTILRVKLAK